MINADISNCIHWQHEGVQSMVWLNNLEFCQFLPSHATPIASTQFHCAGKHAGRSENKLIIVVVHHCHVRHAERKRRDANEGVDIGASGVEYVQTCCHRGIFDSVEAFMIELKAAGLVLALLWS